MSACSEGCGKVSEYLETLVEIGTSDEAQEAGDKTDALSRSPDWLAQIWFLWLPIGYAANHFSGAVEVVNS